MRYELIIIEECGVKEGVVTWATSLYSPGEATRKLLRFEVLTEVVLSTIFCDITPYRLFKN
jgi:hypothetical protein